MKPFVIGLTGGIGSGKSAVSDRFEALGIAVVDADKASRVVVEPGSPALSAIAEHFGRGILDSGGALDRAALRAKVFADPAERAWLERLLHPLIGEEIQRGLAKAASPYAVLVSPLLLEAKQDALADRILVVDVAEATQLARTMRRDANSEAQVRAIIAAQLPRAERLARAHDVLPNDGSLEDLHRAVDALHAGYLRMASERRR
jgi:dephospho-CoA kinase